MANGLADLQLIVHCVAEEFESLKIRFFPLELAPNLN